MSNDETSKEDSALSLSPYTVDELWQQFNIPVASINKHLLIIYSLAVGLQAKRVLEIGIGSTTRALRAALQHTEGILYSCDIDKQRFSHLLETTDQSWHLRLTTSDIFLQEAEPPFDLAIHDGAHDYWQVRQDLQFIIPKMKKYGFICVHDTQVASLRDEMLNALRDGLAGHPVSFVHLPFVCGLTLIRVEKDYGFGEVAPLGSAFPNPTIPATSGVISFAEQVNTEVKTAYKQYGYQWTWWTFRRRFGIGRYQHLRQGLYRLLGQRGFQCLRWFVRRVLRFSG